MTYTTTICEVFLDFHRAFDTVNHDILLSKLHYHSITDTLFNLIKSYLTNRKQYTYINDSESTALISTHGVPQGSVLGPLLFLICINDLNKVNQHSAMHHFPDDTNLLYSSNSPKQTNRYVNHDLKLNVHWARANRISLDVDKTEIVIFRPKRKQITKNMNFRISGLKIIPKTQTKYLGLVLDKHLTWSAHINILKIKLSRANGLPSDLRYSTLQNLLITIHYAIFASHPSYVSQIWGQSKRQIINEVVKLQRKVIRISLESGNGTKISDE